MHKFMLIKTLLLLFDVKQLFMQYYLFTHNIELLNSKLWVNEQYKAYVVKNAFTWHFTRLNQAVTLSKTDRDTKTLIAVQTVTILCKCIDYDCVAIFS